MARGPLCLDLQRLEASHPLDYVWNDWDQQSYFNYANDADLGRLTRLTGRANIALALAVCEWIEARYRPHGLDPELSDYIDAGWAALISSSYSSWVRLEFENWRGALRGPQLIAIGIINEAYYESDDNPEMAWRACYALNLARHVLPPGSRFEPWLAGSLDRLETFHSWAVEGRGEEDIFATEVYQGQLVGRELFDPARPYDPQSASSQLADLLARIDRSNPFLHLPPFAN
jgi:hypothetical protein